MKKHFVTGATGFVGKHLVKALLGQGDKVFILVRPKKTHDLSVAEKQSSELEFIDGNITKSNLGISQRLLNKIKNEGIDFVWHLAANLAFNQNLNDKVRFEANVNGTKNVVAIANYFDSALCHCSTAYICGDAKEFSEDDWNVGQKFRNVYERTKYLAEEIVRSKSKVPFIIFRPSLIIDKPSPGKASECTFGYYRYAYMFFLFKQWMVDCLTRRKILKFLFMILGAKIKVPQNEISIPFLALPFPKNVKINMVPIDYVINSFLKIASNKTAYNKTYHLTHPNPRTFIFLMKTIFEDLSIRDVKYFGVSPKLFELLFKTFYFVIIPWRGYIKSALSYISFITTSPIFIRKNVNLYNSPPKLISKKYFSQINTEAFEKIFPKIKIRPNPRG